MQILRFDSAAAWVQGAADRFCQIAWQNPALRLCLASGNTPLPLYAALVAAVRRKELSFRHARIFALDEYGGLLPDDPGRCVSMLRRHLLDHIDLPPGHFHFLDTLRPDLDRVCAEFDALLAEGLDLSLLGIGLNGHLGLNEPGSPPDSCTRRVELHAETTQASQSYVKGSRLPTWGLTIGMKPLLASKELWLLASGLAKAAIIKRLVSDPEPSPALPASFLKTHPNSFLWVDPAAGSKL